MSSTPPWHVEGPAGRRWVLMDYIELVVHVFHERTREYHLLERPGDARRWILVWNELTEGPRPRFGDRAVHAGTMRDRARDSPRSFARRLDEPGADARQGSEVAPR
jgi:hypothetical protein